jgi:hypothetical protein
VKWDGTRLVVGGGARFAGTTGDAPADAQHPPSGGYTLTEITPRAGTLYFLNVPTASGDRVFAIWITPDQPIASGQPLLIDYRESAAAPKAVASGPLPGLLDDINSPADFFKGGADVATTNLLLTVVVVLLLLAGGSVFNEALEETLADWRIGGVSVPGPISTPVHWVTSAGSSILRGWAALIPGRTWLDRALAPAAVLLGTGFIYSLLDPHFGWNQKTFTLFVSLVVSQGVLALGYEGGKAWLYRRNMHVPSAVRLFPACIGIAVVSVLISRAADFHPGIVVGFVAAAIILEKEEDVSAAERGKACARVAIIFLGISVAAWVAAIPLHDLYRDSPNLWTALPDAIAVSVFVVCLEGLLFSLVPLHFLDGWHIWRWNKLAWLGLFVPTAFLFAQILFNAEQSYFDFISSHRSIGGMIVIAAYLAATWGTWMYLKIREESREEKHAKASPEAGG